MNHLLLSKILLILIPITGLLSLLIPPERLKSLYFHKDLIYEGEYWRFITGHFVYNSWQHGLINLLGIALLFLIFKCLDDAKRYLYATGILICWISTGLLIFSDQLVWYVGFSAVLSGLYIYGACKLYKTARLVSLGIITLFAGFAGLQIYQGELVSGSITNLKSSSYAHALGITGGFVCSFIVAVSDRLTTSNEP